MPRRLGCLLVGLMAAAACSHHSSGPSPSPSAVVVTPPSTPNPGQNPVNHLADVLFPPRNDSFDFRQQLEAKYRDQLHRLPTTTFVDLEGDIVWTQEYLRLRANGCDHITAVQKVFQEIDGGPLAIACSQTPTPFPPRNEPLDFRRQLELKYQLQFQRPATSTFVDIEGDIVWVQEYLRYRVSGCDHATAVAKVFSQIDGGGIAPDCTPPPPPCVYGFTPLQQVVPVGGGTFTVAMSRSSGTCGWSATADAAFITITSAASGPSPIVFTYTVSANPGASRAGTITFTWQGGSAQIGINQAGPPPPTVNAAFRMFDPATSTNPTTECRITSTLGTPTTCVLDGSSSFAFGRNVIVQYSWVVQYTYVTPKTLTFTSANPQFSFSDVCGQFSSTPEGASQPLSVTLTVTDDQGNTGTAVSGTGSQPALAMRLFTCG